MVHFWRHLLKYFGNLQNQIEKFARIFFFFLWIIYASYLEFIVRCSLTHLCVVATTLSIDLENFHGMTEAEIQYAKNVCGTPNQMAWIETGLWFLMSLKSGKKSITCCLIGPQESKNHFMLKITMKIFVGNFQMSTFLFWTWEKCEAK